MKKLAMLVLILTVMGVNVSAQESQNFKLPRLTRENLFGFISQTNSAARTKFAWSKQITDPFDKILSSKQVFVWTGRAALLMTATDSVATFVRMGQHPKVKLSYGDPSIFYDSSAIDQLLPKWENEWANLPKYYNEEGRSGGLMFGGNRYFIVGFEMFETIAVLKVSSMLEKRGHRRIATAMRIWKISDSALGAESRLRPINPCSGFNSSITQTAPDGSVSRAILTCSPR
jgi:hypothetical protein